jgi:tetratricopeptide (TPR) repeat protein
LSSDRRLRLARDLIDIGQLDRAGTLVERELAADPGSADALCTLAYHRLAREDFRAMLTAADAAVAARPQHPWAHQLRGVALLNLRRAPEAVAAVTTSVELAPHAPQGHRLLAQTRLRTGDRVAAYRAARTAVDLDPRSPESHAVLATVYHASGERSLGRAADTAALHLAPDAEWPLRSLAQSDLHRWRLPAAARAYQALLRSHPTSRELPEAFALTLDWLQAAWCGLAAVPALTAVLLYFTGVGHGTRSAVVGALLAAWVAGYSYAHRGLAAVWWRHMRSSETERREPRASVIALVTLLGSAALFGATPVRLHVFVLIVALVFLAVASVLPIGFAGIQVAVLVRDAARRREFRRELTRASSPGSSAPPTPPAGRRPRGTPVPPAR